jgi:hypothetical protein
MKTRLGMKILALAMILMVTGSTLMAQSRIRFKRGSNSATVSGRLGVNGVRSYVLRANRGQVLTATLSSDNGKVDFTQANVHDTQYSRTVEQSGDVEVMIDNHGGPTRYTLTISIQ